MGQPQDQIIAIIPAAGVGKRMGVNIPKQYLTINDQPILSHTLTAFLEHPKVDKVIVAIGKDDEYFSDLSVSNHPKLLKTFGGKERADSVLASLEFAVERGYSDAWVLVHDAARPCITHKDIDLMLESRAAFSQGAILAMPVRDTMKRANKDNQISETVCREQLWHAMTPQMFPLQTLQQNLKNALADNAKITDEASAMEWAGVSPGLVAGRPDNIKVTHAEDLLLARLYIDQHKRNEQ